MDSILFEINQRVSVIVKDYVQDVLTRVSETHDIPFTELEKILKTTKPSVNVSGQTSGKDLGMKHVSSNANPVCNSANTMNCTMQTKLGKPCKYKCVIGQILCKKHFNKANATNETKEHVTVMDKNMNKTLKTSTSPKAKNKSPIVSPIEVKTHHLPLEEQSWFKEYQTSHFPKPPDSFTASPDRDFEDYVLDE